jgi:hypothetical protein
MNFKEYLTASWSTHRTDSKKIADEFKENFKLMETEDDVMEMSGLIVHICGEHLGEWNRGIELLRKLKNNATIKDPSSMNRYVAILTLGNNPNTTIENFSPADQARIYAGTASALASLGGLKNAEKFLKLADEINSTDNDVKEAILKSGERIASTLQMKNEKNENEVDFMNFAISLTKKYANS